MRFHTPIGPARVDVLSTCGAERADAVAKAGAIVTRCEGNPASWAQGTKEGRIVVPAIPATSGRTMPDAIGK